MKTVTLYHGTSSRRAKRILRQGLRSNSQRNFKDSEKGFIYVTVSLRQARAFAITVGGWNAAVIILEIPKTILKRFKKDPYKELAGFRSGKGALRFPGNLPKSIVKRVDYRKPHEVGWVTGKTVTQ